MLNGESESLAILEVAGEHNKKKPPVRKPGAFWNVICN